MFGHYLDTKDLKPQPDWSGHPQSHRHPAKGGVSPATDGHCKTTPLALVVMATALVLGAMVPSLAAD